MALKAVLDTLDDPSIPESLRPFAADLYVQRGGKFVLATEDEPLADAGRRALENERRLRAEAVKQAEAMRQQLAELEAKVSATPPTPAATARPEAPAADDIQKQLAAQRDEFDRQLKRLEKALEGEREVRTKAEQRLAETKITDLLRQAAVERGVVETGIPDAIARARNAWRIAEDGEPRPYDGETVIYSHKDPTRPMSAQEHLELILKDAPHLLRPSNGAGAVGTANGRAAGVLTVTKADLKNPQVYERVKAESAKTGAEIQVVQ